MSSGTYSKPLAIKGTSAGQAGIITVSHRNFLIMLFLNHFAVAVEIKQCVKRDLCKVEFQQVELMGFTTNDKLWPT